MTVKTTRYAPYDSLRTLPVGSSEVIIVLVMLESASEGISSSETAWIDPESTAKSLMPLPPGVTALLRTDKTLLISSF